MIRRLSLSLVFLVGSLAAALGGTPTPPLPFKMILGGIGIAAPAPLPAATITLTPTEMGLGVVAMVAGLIGYHFVFGKYIREQAGVKEEHTTTLGGQPVKAQLVTAFVAQSELESRLDGYVTTEALHDTERRLDSKIDTGFRELGERRSQDISHFHTHLAAATDRLAQKIDEAKGELRDREEDHIVKLHDKVDAQARQLHELAGFIRGKGGKA